MGSEKFTGGTDSAAPVRFGMGNVQLMGHIKLAKSFDLVLPWQPQMGLKIQ